MHWPKNTPTSCNLHLACNNADKACAHSAKVSLVDPEKKISVKHKSKMNVDSQLQKQQLMTSQIGSHIEYLIQL